MADITRVILQDLQHHLQADRFIQRYIKTSRISKSYSGSHEILLDEMLYLYLYLAETELTTFRPRIVYQLIGDEIQVKMLGIDDLMFMLKFSNSQLPDEEIMKIDQALKFLSTSYKVSIHQEYSQSAIQITKRLINVLVQATSK